MRWGRRERGWKKPSDESDEGVASAGRYDSRPRPLGTDWKSESEKSE